MRIVLMSDESKVPSWMPINTLIAACYPILRWLICVVFDLRWRRA